jgi:uncharacterized protein involved in outer membrane biogenesis
MKRSFLRWAIGITAAIAVVAAGLAIAAWLILDSLDLKIVVARVESAVEQSTGRKLTIGAGPKFGFYPRVSVVMRDVTLANMAAGTRAEMPRLKEVGIGLALAPLLTGGRAGLRVALVEFGLLLEANERGEVNWILALSPEEALARLKEAVDLLAGRVSLESARIENATVRVQDARTRRTMNVAIRRADLDRRPDDRYRIEIGGGVDGQPAAIEAELKLPAAGATMLVRLSASLAGADASLEGVVMPGWPADGTDVKVAIEMKDAARLGEIFGVRLGKIPPIKLGAQVTGADGRLRAKPLQLSMARSTLNGEVRVVRFAPRPRVEATLDAPALDLAALQDAAGSPSGSGGPASCARQRTAAARSVCLRVRRRPHHRAGADRRSRFEERRRAGRSAGQGSRVRRAARAGGTPRVGRAGRAVIPSGR